jgi:hypothetical protein
MEKRNNPNADGEMGRIGEGDMISLEARRAGGV